MDKPYVAIDYRGTRCDYECDYEAELVGAFDNWKEAANFLISRGFMIVIELDLFVDPYSEGTHWAKIYNRDIYTPPEFEDMTEP